MSLHSPRLLASTLFAVILSAGLAMFGRLWGIPRWDVVFDGALAPWVSVYGGWGASIGFVALGSIVIATCIVASWKQQTYHYLILAAGAVAALTFIALGLPATVRGQIRDEVRVMIVGLCGLMVLTILGCALKARLTRRFRT
jgi:apolipoprotein N-acyltransferase